MKKATEFWTAHEAVWFLTTGDPAASDGTMARSLIEAGTPQGDIVKANLDWTTVWLGNARILDDKAAAGEIQAIGRPVRGIGYHPIPQTDWIRPPDDPEGIPSNHLDFTHASGASLTPWGASFPQWEDVRFRRLDIEALKRRSDQEIAARGRNIAKPQPPKAEVEKAWAEYVAQYPVGGYTPSREESEAHMRSLFPTINRPTLRNLRNDPKKTPEEWRERGVRKTAKLANRK